MDYLTIPNKLYGRDREILKLIGSFEQISRGYGEILLVPGFSGVGKTALVRELASPIRDRNGFFIQGKFDQYQQNVPYFAFRSALAELCRELQAGSEQQCAQRKADILHAIGNMGQLLVDMAPEFESFLGVQPPLGDISPQEARHRFASVFRNFLKAVCRPEHPVVLFIDDWQWADAASFELLKQMQIGIELRYLLVIVSYRDNEVDSSHPLTSTVDDLRSQSVPVDVIHVENIGVKDVQEILDDTLIPASEDNEGLASFIHNRTLGNPFFVRAFFSFLYELNVVWFDHALDCWKWSADRIYEKDLPVDVIELFVLKLRRMDTDQQNLYSLAACLGSCFDLQTLSIVSGRPAEECRTLLFPYYTEALLLPLEIDAIAPSSGDSSNAETYVFLHDRVQQAAYSLIEPAQLPQILLRIGRLMLTSIQPEKLNERLFQVADNMNAGHHLIQDTTEQVKVLELNIAAGRKAYAATAYRSALHFYRAASFFLEQPGFTELLWRDSHELTIQFYKERAECEFLEGNHAEAESCVQQAVAHAGTAIEKADAISMLIVHDTLLARYPEAIAAGQLALAALGISLPEDGYEDARDDEIAQVRRELGTRPICSLVDLPVMSNPEMLMASRILITMGPPCYRSHQRLWGVIVPKVVNLTLRYGNIPQVGYSHTAFGGLLGWVDDDYAAAKEFGELATSLMTGTFISPSDRSVFYLMIGSSIRHWFKHMEHASQDYADAYEIGLQSSNLQYAAYAFGHNMYCSFYQGIPLSALIQESLRSLEFSRTRHNQWAIDLLEGGVSIFDALTKEIPESSGQDVWSEEEYLRRVEDHYNIQVTCIYKVLKTTSLMVLGDYKRALVMSDEAEPLIYTVGTQGLLPWPEHVFARLLILTALYSEVDTAQQAQWRPELDRIMSRLHIWSGNCPENFEHKYLLAAAELARIDGRPGEAMQLYDKAIEAAHSGNFLQWEGIANERAHGFWMESGNELVAHDYWRQAYVCYDRWGAVAKLRSMEAAHRAYIKDRLLASDKSGTLDRGTIDTVLEKRITQLRSYAFEMQQTGLRMEAENHAEELARATERLRLEIVERSRAEEALKTSEERFRILFERHSAVKLLIDPATGNIVDANESAVDFYGWSANELKKMNIQQINTLSPEDVKSEMQKAESSGKTGFVFKHRRADGSVRDVEVFSNSVEIAGNNILYSIIHDITERKLAEADLLESEERYKFLSYQFEAILDHIPGLVFYKDKNNNFIKVNRFLANSYGKPKEELEGKNLADIFPKADAGKYHQDDLSVIESGTAKLDIEETWETVDGAKWVSSSKIPFVDRTGEIIGIIGVSTDITGRKIAEEALKLSLEEKTALLKEIHHRVKNNLQIVASLLNLQASRVQGSETENALRDVEGRILSMALLHEALYRSGNFTRIDFAAYVEELCAHLLDSFGTDLNRVELEQQVDCIGIPLNQSVPCGLIISELISNALKYAFPGNLMGKITVELNTQDERDVVLRVSDNGIGMPDGFNPERASTLGLRLISNLTRQLGGQCVIESPEAGGTAIQVSFSLE